ncbi:MAG TPA: ABC transporter permease [Candidatus Limnocylindria bacterium]|nr:ABC transporter permease [Candidatus Limnocylindria bacterium]
MTASDLLGLALRALRGHRLRSGLSLLGVAIGVAAVIVLTALGEGALRYVTAEFRDIGAEVLIVTPGKTETTGMVPGVGGAPNDLTLGDAEAVLRRVPGVERVAPIVMGTETVAAGERRRQVAIVGSTHEFFALRGLELSRGELLPPGDMRRGAAVAVLGSTAARELFPGRDPVGRIVRVAGLRARVIGVLAPRGTHMGLDLNEVAVVPVATAMRLFNRRSLFRLMVQMRSYQQLDAGKRAVIALLAERHGEEDVTVLTQDAIIASLSSIVRVLTLALAAIAAVSLAVAGTGIMNVMLVSVAERTPEVGLLRALGVRRRQVLAVFLAEAALLSTTGGLAGLLLGWLGTRLLVALYPALPAAPPLWAVAASLLLASGVGLLFGLLPARRAARRDPVEALAPRA